MKKGNIGVNSTNLFPLIKSALYSERDIFLRELISNAIDAELKIKTILQSSTTEEMPECTLDDLKIYVKLDENESALTISDYGVGMTEKEIEKYINQIAFSGANDFLEKYKDASGIIGHFGLGFYSAFMVAKKVDIVTRSYKKDSPLLRWTCDGSPEFSISEEPGELSGDRKFGTDVIIYFDDNSRSEFSNKQAIEDLLKKYSRFAPVPLYFGKKKEWDTEKKEWVETEEDNQINSEKPIWDIPPQELEDDDYKRFYRYMYPQGDEPQFWIRLNVSEPFTLKGVLFFPKLDKKANFTKRNNIQLFCNQVFVTDNIEGIVPEFMSLLFGVIDSPDIPLNVSRSYLQNDNNVQKMSKYITRKVADKLKDLYSDNRIRYELNWNDLRLFVNYGIFASDNEDFWDRVRSVYLVEDSERDYFTIDEYLKLLNPEHRDINDNLVVLYTTNKEKQWPYIEAAKNKGYRVCVMKEKMFDLFAIQFFEKTLEKVKFTQVDADIIDRLIKKDSERDENLDEIQELLSGIFKKPLDDICNKKDNKTMFIVTCENLGEDYLPAIVMQNEYTRRTKENARYRVDGYTYDLDVYTMTLNFSNSCIKEVVDNFNRLYKEDLDKAKEILGDRQKELDKVEETLKDIKIEDLTEEQEKLRNDALIARNNAREDVEKIFEKYNEKNIIIPEIIDIGLLSAGMIGGKDLYNFLNRTSKFI